MSALARPDHCAGVHAGQVRVRTAAARGGLRSARSGSTRMSG